MKKSIKIILLLNFLIICFSIPLTAYLAAKNLKTIKPKPRLTLAQCEKSLNTCQSQLKQAPATCEQLIKKEVIPKCEDITLKVTKETLEEYSSKIRNLISEMTVKMALECSNSLSELFSKCESSIEDLGSTCLNTLSKISGSYYSPPYIEVSKRTDFLEEFRKNEELNYLRDIEWELSRISGALEEMSQYRKLPKFNYPQFEYKPIYIKPSK